MKRGRRRRDLSLIVTGMLIAAVLSSPAGAHVGGTVKHLWIKHIKPNVTKLVYTKAKSDKRYVAKSASPGGDLDGTYASPVVAPDAIDSSKVANGSLRVADMVVAHYEALHSFGSIAAGTCVTHTMASSSVLAGDLIMGYVGSDMDTRLISPLYKMTTSGSAVYRLCNIGETAIDTGLGLYSLDVLR